MAHIRLGTTDLSSLSKELNGNHRFSEELIPDILELILAPPQGSQAPLVNTTVGVNTVSVSRLR
jgi:hypothetical protein